MPQMPWESMLRYMPYHPRWYEDVARRSPDSTHLAEYRAVMPDSWRLRRDGCRLVAEPPGAPGPDQGWLLHVSATSRTSVATLRRCLPVLRDAGVPFSFLMDTRAVRVANGTFASRTAGGKVLTVCPPDDATFRWVAGELTDALAEFSGPYVLTDRRCPGSRVVSYRYGAFTARHRLLPSGEREPVIAAPDGTSYPDEHAPHWSVPPWAVDPFKATEVARAGAVAAADAGPNARASAGLPPRPLLGGRYEVRGVLRFSNRGGVYRALDTVTGADVVLREARPGVEVGPRGRDAIEVLRHEYDLLAELAELAAAGLFVRPLDFFTEWEHAYLVEEFVPGCDLGELSAAFNPLDNLEFTRGPLRDYYQRFQGLWAQVADAIAACHERGIVLGDVSPANVRVTAGDRVRIIDLESAFREGADHGAGLSTPGMVTRRARAAGHGDRRTDYYALGGLMLSAVLACQAGDVIEHELPLRLLDAVAADLGLPAELVTLIRDLYDEDAGQFDPAQVRRRIADLPFATAWQHAPRPAHPAGARPGLATALHERIDRTLEQVADYLVATADPGREDRLFPADPLVFETNPLSLAHGAYGCLYALHGLRGGVPGDLLAWALSRPASHRDLPPGLYYGSAGAAWALSALGQHGPAARLLRQAAGHPLLHAEPGVLTGAAGHGMACLRLWRDSGRPEFLGRARTIGQRLAAAAVREEDRAHWTDARGRTPVGYAYGASGTAMFLLALHAATGDPQVLELGRAALEFDLSCAVYSPAGLMSFPEYAEGDAPAVRRHCWDRGTAGVLTTLLRYWDVTRDERLRKDITAVLPDVRRAYADSPQLFHGISGIGNALLDAYEFLGDPELLGDAERAAEAVLCCALRRPEGVVFPGRHLLRESCDLATGSAGVALFLGRVRYAAPGLRTNRNFVLDDLLVRRTPAAGSDVRAAAGV